MKIITPEQMRALDSLTIKNGRGTGEELMRRAGELIADRAYGYAMTCHQSYLRRFVLLAGKGNNAGDAYVAAGYLHEKYNCEDVLIYSVCASEELSSCAKIYADSLNRNVKVTVKKTLEMSDFQYGDIVIDGLLGTGFSGTLKFPYYEWVALVNQLKVPVISIDIPSGLDADSGKGPSIIADLTLTIGLPKRGFFISEGIEASGKVEVLDIGFPHEYINEIPSQVEFYTEEIARNYLERIPCDLHKKSRGSVLVIGGSSLYSGAPILSAEAALRSSAGFVTVAVPDMCRGESHLKSLIVRKIQDNGTGFFQKESLPEIMELVSRHDSIVIGPGMGLSESNIYIIKAVLNFAQKVIVDADALNLIALSGLELPDKADNIIFTPHPGEAAGLMRRFGIKSDLNRLQTAAGLSKALGGTVVLKGNKTVTASDKGTRLMVNSSGSAVLATAGSGDVLSGILGSLASSGSKTLSQTAEFGVYIHGLAGDIAYGDFGFRGATADDLINYISRAMKKISPFG